VRSKSKLRDRSRHCVDVTGEVDLGARQEQVRRRVVVHRHVGGGRSCSRRCHLRCRRGSRAATGLWAPESIPDRPGTTIGADRTARTKAGWSRSATSGACSLVQLAFLVAASFAKPAAGSASPRLRRNYARSMSVSLRESIIVLLLQLWPHNGAFTNRMSTRAPSKLSSATRVAHVRQGGGRGGGGGKSGGIGGRSPSQRPRLETCVAGVWGGWGGGGGGGGGGTRLVPDTPKRRRNLTLTMERGACSIGSAGGESRDRNFGEHHATVVLRRL
jgi:hypothetical protein